MNIVISDIRSNTPFAQLQQEKIAELEAACNASISAGFTSSALGVAHTYPADIDAMVYWNATMHRFTSDPTFTTVKQKTLDAGYLDHTKQQFFQAFNDGHAFGIQQDSKLAGLKVNVGNAKTPRDLDKIQWT